MERMDMEAKIKTEYHLRHRICQVCENGLSSIDEMNLSSCETRVDVLIVLWRSYEENHIKLLCEPFYAQDSSFYVDEEKFAQTEHKYLIALGKFKNHVVELKAKMSTSRSALITVEPPAIIQSELPAIDLPRFSGKFEDWIEFKYKFQSLVLSRGELSDALKMQYLLSCLPNEAASLVRYLPVSADQYEHAWKILSVNYQKNQVIVKKHLDELFSIKPMQSKAASEMSRIITTTTKILNELEALGRPTKYWDDILIHLTIARLDSQSQKIWETLVDNSAKPIEQPSTYADLKKFLDIRQYTLELLEHARSE
ncbi:uncharacterized protein LOC124416294 [Diprion similis]|uniref:uncharacterized protein LOC124416294 n=1 Tax=Diprion similis TaxID=362088 RepID=UPI001EF777C8|nr:uncharacterized protein LOC124416294 [Diprion similis]